MNSRLKPRLRVLSIVLVTCACVSAAFASGPQEKILYSFQGYSAPNLQDGEYPATLISDGAGNFFGVTNWGGICNMAHSLSYQCGTVFELSPPATAGGVWTETVIYEFGTNLLDGQDPLGNLIRDKQGNLYGTTFSSGGGYNGNFGCGTFFELSPPAQAGDAWTETILYNFQGNADGCGPMGTLVSDSDGNIFGATSAGGTLPKGYDTGGIFEMSPPATAGGVWTESFTQSLGTGIYPAGPLAINNRGRLYGATIAYGSTYPATIFQLVPPVSSGGAWTGTTIYSFQGGTDGSAPGGFTLDGRGDIYGVTENGGTANYGTAFRLSPSQNGPWTKTTLYSFQGGNDGAEPIASMTFDRIGNLYGTTFEGGGAAACSTFQGCGTVFKLTRGTSGWSERVLHSFQGGSTDGEYLSSPVLVTGSGIFGTTNSGGTVSPYFFGIVFEIR